jgi:2-iminobutanoate/2-iminopropanoate deaminase
MNITAPQSPRLPKPRFLYSPVVKAGPWFIFSGMVALDAASGKLETGGPGAETEKILQNLTAALPDFGLSLADLVQARIYTTRFDEFPAINAAWEKSLATSNRPPARTSVGVAALPLGASVEMEFVFYSDGAP